MIGLLRRRTPLNGTGGLREFNLDAWRVRDTRRASGRDRLRLGAEDFARLDASDLVGGPDEIEIIFPISLEAAALGCARRLRDDLGFTGELIASGVIAAADRRLLSSFGFDRIPFRPDPEEKAAAAPQPASPIGQAEYQSHLFWSF